MSEIWVLVDISQGTIRNVTYEVLTAARKLKEKSGAIIAAVYVGDSAGSIEGNLSKYGAEKARSLPRHVNSNMTISHNIILSIFDT